MQRVARFADLEPGVGVFVEAYGRAIALFLVDGRVFAIDDVCPHRGASLSEGFIEDGRLYCSLHSWCFDLHTGAMIGQTAPAVPTYPVEVRDGEVFVGRPLKRG